MYTSHWAVPIDVIPKKRCPADAMDWGNPRYQQIFAYFVSRVQPSAILLHRLDRRRRLGSVVNALLAVISGSFSKPESGCASRSRLSVRASF